MGKRLRVGIIGQGRSGRDIHAHALTGRVSDLFEIVAVADVLQDRCDRAAKELGISRFALQRKLDKYGMDVPGAEAEPAEPELEPEPDA